MDIDDKELYWLTWFKKIEEIRAKYEVKPIDAELYTPLQVVPGYNGIKINVEESLKNLEKIGKWDEEQLVIEEVEPYLSISDFIPAPIFHGNPNKKIVSIMITVAWGNEYIPQILECFKKEDAKATFFF